MGLRLMKVKATSDGKLYRNGASVGLGDTVAKMTKAVGIKPCGGCKKRQEWLNKKVPYKTRVINDDN